MRAKLLFVVGLALLLGACAGNVNKPVPPAPLKKELLAGKWKNSSDDQIIAGYEFAEDGTLTVTIRKMEKPVLARYTWNGERTISVEYQAPADVLQAYKATAKAYKDDVMDRIKTGKLPERAGPSILSSVQDELPASETFHVAIAEQPRLLMLGREEGGSQTFEKAD
jgi:hypothetical protein